MTLERFCLKCLHEIFYDTTEHHWCCECFAIQPIPDEDGMPSLEFIPPYWVEVTELEGQIDSLVFWMDELLKLARELQGDLKRFYEPIKGWPPHIEALEGQTDFDTVLEAGRQFLAKFKSGEIRGS
jgi:hypothetical protein